MITSEYLNHRKRGGVFIHRKKYVPLTRRTDICELNGCIVNKL